MNLNFSANMAGFCRDSHKYYHKYFREMSYRIAYTCACKLRIIIKWIISLSFLVVHIFIIIVIKINFYCYSFNSNNCFISFLYTYSNCSFLFHNIAIHMHMVVTCLIVKKPMKQVDVLLSKIQALCKLNHC